LREIYEERLAIMTIDGKVPEAQARNYAIKYIRELQNEGNRGRVGQPSTAMEQRQEVSDVRSYGNGNASYRTKENAVGKI
jgi:hypothetical protein